MLVVAVLVRVIGLGHADLWLDEAMSYHFATLSWPELTAQLRLDSGPPLYYLLLHLWRDMVGSHEAALRSLSVIFSVATVALVFATGRRWFGPAVGIRAALLLAVLPVPVFYAHQARAYTLLTLAGLAAFWSLHRWLAEGRARYLWPGGIATTAALYSHNYALFLLPAMVAVLVLIRPARRRFLGAVGFIAAVVVAYAPWGLTVLRAQLGNVAPTAWMGMVWDANGAAGSLHGSLRALAPGARQEPYVALDPISWAGLVSPLLIGVLLLLGVAATIRRDRSPEDRVPSICLLAYALAPLGAALLASALVAPVYLPGRIDQLVVPALVLLLAIGIEAVPWRPVRWVSQATIVGLAIVALLPNLKTDSEDSDTPGDRALAAAIATALEPGDAIVTTGLTRAPLSYHLRARPEPTFYSFPAEVEHHLGNLDAEAMLGDRPALAAEARTLLDQMTSTPGWSGRAIIVFVPDALGAALLNTINADARRHRDRLLGDFEQSRLGVPVRVFLLDYR